MREVARATRKPARVRLKPAWIGWIWLLLVVQAVTANRPPRFLIDGQSEIVVRLKEGPETPVGKFKVGFKPNKPIGESYVNLNFDFVVSDRWVVRYHNKTERKLHRHARLIFIFILLIILI